MSTPEPFSTIKIRTSALVFCGNEVALLRRERPDSVHYTTVGGNVRRRAKELPLRLRQLGGLRQFWFTGLPPRKPWP